MKTVDLFSFVGDSLFESKYYSDLNIKLLDYLTENIIPTYNYFDKGHNVTHILDVIERSINIVKDNNMDININLLISSAALHDIGISINRTNHAKHSCTIIDQLTELKKFFSPKEIKQLKEAVEDHSTSIGRKPRNIYGQIVSDADKDSDVNIYIMRSMEFCKKYHSEFTEEEIAKDIFKDINKRFGDNGKVKFYIENKTTNHYYNQMNRLSKNFSLFKHKFYQIMKFVNLCKSEIDSIESYKASLGKNIQEKIDNIENQVQTI